jgi:hypothetical protein
MLNYRSDDQPVRMARRKRVAAWLPLATVLVCALLVPGAQLTALTVGADFRIGNLALEPDRTVGETSFAGDAYPWGLSLYANETLADELTLDAGFYMDPILRNVFYSLFSYQQSIFTLTVGPFFGLFNAPGSILKAGLATGVRVEIPGIAFVAFRADSTIGGRLVAVGDYLQEFSDLTAGFWVRNAIGSVSLRSASYTEKQASADVVDTLTEYEFAAQIFQKNVPYHVEIALGYHDLSKSFVGATTTTHTLGSLILGTRFELTLQDYLGLIVDLESSIYTFGQGALLGVSNPGPGGYLFRVTTSVSVDIDRLTEEDVSLTQF